MKAVTYPPIGWELPIHMRPMVATDSIDRTPLTIPNLMLLIAVKLQLFEDR
jgi:hypothetical protein